MSELVGKAIGGVANGVIQRVDVDGVVQRIDVNEVLEKVEWNDLLDKIDWDHLLDRIDMDKLVDRIPVQKIVDKSDLKNIIARSTTGVFGNLLDLVRAQAIRVDQTMQGFAFCRCCWRKRGYLPPDPRNVTEEYKKCPKKASSLAVAVQGRAAGIFTRFLSWWIDGFILLVVSGLLVAITEFVIEVFKGDDFEFDAEKWYVPFFFLAISMFYYTFMLAALGKTIGKAIMGLLVVECHGKRLSFVQTIPRAFFMSTQVLMIAFSLLGLVRRDRRGVHDILVCTTVVYAWDAKRFQEQEKNLTDVERLGPAYASVLESNTLGPSFELDP